MSERRQEVIRTKIANHVFTATQHPRQLEGLYCNKFNLPTKNYRFNIKNRYSSATTKFPYINAIATCNVRASCRTESVKIVGCLIHWRFSDVDV